MLDTIKLLEENIGNSPFNINGIKIFFDQPPRVVKIKTKIKKLDLIKLKSIFYIAKETINQKESPQNGREYLQMK